MQLTEPVSARDHVRGPRSAVVSLVEYGDFECPYCRAAEPIAVGLLEALGEQLSLTFRHFPMSALHPHAQHAAEVAEAAGAQGKFWEMHYMLFEHQHALDADDLVRYAAALGLDLARFSSELIGHIHAARVREDFMSGVRSGVNSTPTFFINSVRHDGSFDLDTLLDAMEAAIER